VRLRRLQLQNFRCFKELDLLLPPGRVVISGGNGQGKSTLLEAAYVLGTTRAAHAGNDRELIGWGGEEQLPFAKASGVVDRAQGELTIEVLLALQPQAGQDARFVKRVRVNGAARRAVDAIGLLNVVLFTPRDLELVDGGPSERRRYLDVLLCQIDRQYTRRLSAYNRALAQRNHLLRRLRERDGNRTELDVWDERLAAEGGEVLARRIAAVGALSAIAADVHADLVGGGEKAARLAASYVQSVAGAPEAATDAEAAAGADAVADAADAAGRLSEPTEPARQAECRFQAARLLAGFRRRRAVDVARGATTVGPHRDDLRFSVGGIDMRLYGSRGQQRTVALAWKLAEARLMTEETGEQPLLLLDDVLSELDGPRRKFLLARMAAEQQTLLTTTEPDRVDASFRAGALMLQVAAGAVSVVSPCGGT
jgi:DNA replication and repair protein RecF